MNNSEIKKLGRPRTIEEKTRICAQCKKEFQYRSADRSGIFCTQNCFVLFSKQNANDYRIKAFSLLPNECFYCSEKEKKNLQVHHLDRDRFNNDIENLQIICTSCHSKQHKGHAQDGRKNKFKEAQILQGIRMILDGLRLDLKDENFKGTPERVLRSYYELYEGQGADLQEKVKDIFSAAFPSDYDGMVIVDNIKCFGVCPHHLLPVEYVVDVGYISKQKMIGISKLPRIVQLLSRRLVLQESFTHDIVDALMKNLKADGVMVIVKGKHNCMRMRGIEKPDTTTITSEVAGLFKTDNLAKSEFLNLVNQNKK